MAEQINRVRRIAAGCAALAVAATVVLAAVPANAAEESGVVGGWSEESGRLGAATSGIGAFATANHRGRSEEKIIGGTTHKRAHGWTTWAGVKHYTTARLEHYWPASGVIATSERQYGTGGTEATSPWRAFNPNATSNGNGAAKTYYGR